MVAEEREAFRVTVPQIYTVSVLFSVLKRGV